jgi:hypothetical protein
VLGLPTSELVDLAVGTDELWGRAAAALGERVAGAASPEEALARLQQHVVGRLGAAPGPDPLVLEAVRRLMPWRTDDVGSLTSSLYISARQLRRRCQAATGLAPKALHRMLRFQGFLALTQEAIARGRAPTQREVGDLATSALPGAPVRTVAAATPGRGRLPARRPSAGPHRGAARAGRRHHPPATPRDAVTAP